MSQNYPNPFNPTTGIRFQVPAVSNVELKIFDIVGREVAILVDEEKQPGNYQSTWDASDHASGVYFYRMKAGSFTATKKLVILK